MSGAGGKWMASSVMEGQIQKLRDAGYLSNGIVHRLPDEGELIPTPSGLLRHGRAYPKAAQHRILV